MRPSRRPGQNQTWFFVLRCIASQETEVYRGDTHRSPEFALWDTCSHPLSAARSLHHKPCMRLLESQASQTWGTQVSQSNKVCPFEEGEDISRVIIRDEFKPPTHSLAGFLVFFTSFCSLFVFLWGLIRLGILVVLQSLVSWWFGWSDSEFLFVCLFASLSVCMFVCLSIFLLVSLSVCLFVCLIVCLFVCLFDCLVGWLAGWLAGWLFGKLVGLKSEQASKQARTCSINQWRNQTKPIPKPYQNS